MQDADAQDLSQGRPGTDFESHRPMETTGRNPLSPLLRKVASNAIVTAVTKSGPVELVDGTVADQILAETPECSAARSELHNECFRERYLRAAAIVKVDVSPVTWAAFEQTVIQGRSCEEAAASLGKSLGTIYAARSRILKRLQSEVQRLEGDAS